MAEVEDLDLNPCSKFSSAARFEMPSFQESVLIGGSRGVCACAGADPYCRGGYNLCSQTPSARVGLATEASGNFLRFLKQVTNLPSLPLLAQRHAPFSPNSPTCCFLYCSRVQKLQPVRLGRG